MAEKLTLIRPESRSSMSRVFSTEDAELSPLPIGGITGNKYLLSLKNPRFEQNPLRGDISEQLTFFAKEHPGYSFGRLLNLAKYYRELYNLGFPVPPTTRVFRLRNRFFLAMSNMTENGIYKIWGYNNEPNYEEVKTLMSMNLGSSELTDVENQLVNLCKLADDTQKILNWWYFHVRQNIQTTSINIVLLDLLYKRENKTLSHSKNQYAAEKFLMNLRSSAKGIEYS